MAFHPGLSGARRLLCLGSIVLFCLCLSPHLALVLYWEATGSRPPVQVEPRGYANVLGDMEPRLRVVDREIPDLPYRVTTDSQGFRGRRPFPGKRSDRTLRILCLGDSYTFGVGVEDQETYPALLETMLRGRLPGYDVQVLNAGVPFYDIFDEWSYFTDKGANLKPDVVVLQFYINDLEAMAGSFFREDLLRRQGGRYNAFDQAIGWEAAARRINAWIEGRFPVLWRLVGAGPPLGPPSAETGPLQAYHIRPTDAERALIGDRNRMLKEDKLLADSRLWVNYRRALLALRDAVEAQGARFLLVLAPDVSQVREDLNQPAAALVPFCRDNGIPVIDLARQFRAMTGDKREEYFLVPRNPHINAVGNTLFAKAVADALDIQAGPAGPVVRVSPSERAFAYDNPVSLNLRFDETGVPETRQGPVRVSTVRSTNLVSWSEDFGGQNSIQGLRPDVTQGPDGELVLRLEADVPLDQVTVTLFRRLLPPINGYVWLAWSRDDQEYHTALMASEKDVPEPEAFESGRFAEIDLRDAPVRRLYLRLRLRNEARVFAESKDPPWRRFEIVCYPAQGDGS